MDHARNEIHAFHFSATYIPWLILFISVFTLNLKTGAISISSVAADSIRIVLVAAAGLISVFYLFTNRQAFRHIFDPPLLCFLLYGLVGIVSGAYASEGYYAIWKAVEVCVDVLAIIVVFQGMHERTPFLNLYRIAVLLLVFLFASVLIGAFIAPFQAFLPYPRALLKVQLAGVLPIINPNTVGFISALLCLLCFIRFLTADRNLARFLYFLSLVITFVALVYAQSRTSIAALTIAMFAYLIFVRRIKLLVFLMVIVSFMFTLGVTTAYLTRGQNIQQLKTMSSRTVAWERAYGLFEKSPIIGNGFMSASKYDVLRGSPTSTLHGSVFDVLAGVGLAGFVPWVFAIAYTGFRLVWPRGNLPNRNRSMLDQRIRAELIAVYVLILIRALTSSLLASHDVFLLLFLILSAYSIIPQTVTPDDAAA